MLRQFPDCRFVYAFFRARTLGYDVYPEDHFLQNFPWQLYGGLWSCDDARFARAEPMNALTALALRQITSEGSSAAVITTVLQVLRTSSQTAASSTPQRTKMTGCLLGWVHLMDLRMAL